MNLSVSTHRSFPAAEDTRVLIPAAGPVPEEVLSLSNIGTPCMIPVAGRPVVHWMMQYLTTLGFTKFTIAVPKRGLFVEDYVGSVFGESCHVEYIVPDKDAGLGYTVGCLAAAHSEPSSLVVLGDTFFTFDDGKEVNIHEPFVLTHPVSDPHRWCVVHEDDARSVVSLADKPEDLKGEQTALIGVYFFPDSSKLRAAADAAAENAHQDRVEMSTILQEVHAGTPIRCVTPAQWLDCGNADRQAASHKALLQARAFNSLDVDSVLSTITKRSENKHKFIDEINYMRLLPTDLSVLFPRVVDFSTDWNDPYVKMEYYGYPSLAQAFVYENIEPGVWKNVFQHLNEILRDVFGAHRQPLARGAVQQMVLEKTRDRNAQLHKGLVPGTSVLTEEFLTAPEVTINGKVHKNLPSLWDDISKKANELEKTAVGSVIHGDLCLSNILYDFRNRILKLIDPRGSFGPSGVVGDIRYDVAKLYHSVYGGYDFIVNDLFSCRLSGTEGTLDIRSRKRHETIAGLFCDAFFPAFDSEDITFLTAMLFLSMPALHYDVPQRQAAMYMRGIQLLNEVWSQS